jgi:phosphoribosylformylglycinamidine synthase
VKGRVFVFLKEGVFDPQGNTVALSLKQLGFKRVKDVRIGKVIDVELESASKDEAKAELHKMCEKLLANPVIESFKYEVMG